MALGVGPADEVITTPLTFVCTATCAIALGAKVVLADVDPATMCLDPQDVRSRITNKTKAIVPVHYAGVGCEMDAIMDIARRHNLLVIEDAAQGIMSTYKGRPLGSIGHLATLSFHQTKNIISGERGALLVNDSRLEERAEMVREKGTNRSQFFRGQVDKYSWVDIGSSFLPGEIIAAFLGSSHESVRDLKVK